MLKKMKSLKDKIYGDEIRTIKEDLKVEKKLDKIINEKVGKLKAKK